MEKGLVTADGEEPPGPAWDFIRTPPGSWEVCSGQVGVGGEDISFEAALILGTPGFPVPSIQRSIFTCLLCYMRSLVKLSLLFCMNSKL